MAKKKNFHSKWESFKYNHIWFKTGIEYVIALLATIASALAFSIGVTCFVAPHDFSSPLLTKFVTGGASGIAQVIEMIIYIIAPSAETSNVSRYLYSVLFFVVNIPITVVAFKGIGLRFGVFTFINIGLVSLFTWLFRLEPINANIVKLAMYISEHAGGFLSRAVFGGVCTGLSSAIAYKVETSTGGIDVISYYLSLKKSTSVGKYSALINSVIITTFSILSLVKTHGENWEVAACCFLFSIIYMIFATIIVDMINTRNKKMQLQIITKNPNLPNYLLANIPHGATIVNGKGAFSGADCLVIYMVVQSVQVKQVIKLIKSIDADSFVGVTSLQQVYGKFYIRPVK